MTQGELSTYGTRYEASTSKVRVGAIAERQRGQITRAQLRALEIPRSTVDRWNATGYLHRVLPAVYSVGHRATDEDSRLFSLVLFAGPGAALSHGTSAHRRGWLRYDVAAVHISTPRRIRRRFPAVVFHSERTGERELVNGIPCTTVTQTLLDLAATEPPRLVLRSLAQLDYERRLQPDAIRRNCGRGRPGSAALLSALDLYIPAMSRTKSELEDDFLLLCQRFGIPIPTVNATLFGEEPDCYWPQFGLVVELDGEGNHGTPAQRRRDRGKDMKLRARGLTVVRYGTDQVIHDDAAVAANVLSQITRLARRAV